MNFAYYLLLLLIIFLSISTIKKNIQLSPKKIKIYLSFVITLFLLRHIGLFLLCILKNSTIIYYLKPIIFLNHITVPLMILAISYVYLRAEKLKFGGSYLIAGIVVEIYIWIIGISKVTINISSLYGFIIKINHETLIFLFSLILLGMLIVLNVFLLDKPFVNKKGIWFIILSIIVVMLEDVIILGGIKIFPYSVVGDLIFLIIMNMVLDSFKKIKGNIN